MSRSIRILVVDDEYILRNWLSMLIEKNAERGFSLAGSAASGPDAIAICQTDPVDVVITDIKMEPMNGIDMIRELKALQLGLRYVIISNYEDFSAAQEGMRLGASEYLLKAEVEEEDILTCLARLRREILEGEADAQPARRAVTDGEILRQQYLIDLLRDNPLTETGPERLAAAGIRLDEKNLRLLAFSPDRYMREIRFTSPEYKGLLRLASSSAQRLCPNALCLINLDGCVLALTDAREGARLEVTARAVIQAARDQLRFSVSAAVSRVFCGFAALRGAYLSLREQFERRFYTQGGCLCGEMDAGATPQIRRDEARDEAIQGLLNRFEYAAAFQKTRLLLGEIGRSASLPPAQARQLCVRLALLFALPGDAEAPETRRRMGELEEIPLFEDLARATLSLIDDTLHRRMIQLAPEGPIEQAVQYMNHNFAGDVSLGTVARVVHLSESYLSKLFKEKTGESFNAYLSGCRVNHAKYLLRNSSARIGAIGAMVGYPNVSYFTQVFKRATGLSPEQYRAEQQKEPDRKST